MKPIVIVIEQEIIESLPTHYITFYVRNYLSARQMKYRSDLL